MASRAERRRAEIMAKARRSGTLSLSEAEKAMLTSGQRQKLGIGVTQTGLDVPGRTRGGTDFSTVPQTPGALSADGRSIVPVGTPGSTVPDTTSSAPPRFDGYTPDSFYTQAMQTLADNRARALASATEGERSLANDFGLGITQDDTGARFTGTWAGSDAAQGGIDPTNPFSRASLLNKSYFTAGRVGEGSYANRGMLTSGAYQRNQQRDAFRFESGKDQLLKQFASGLQGYRDQRSNAQNNYSSGQSQAGLDLFGRNRDNYDRMYPS